MAAFLFRRGTGLSIRCIHREMCRVIWRPQTAQLSFKPSDRKEPRRTHIKKAKPQPAVDVAKLLEQLFSQRRPGTSPPARKARPTKASSMSTKPPTSPQMKISTSDVPPLVKTEPVISVFHTAPLSTELNSTSPTNPSTSYSSKSPPQSPLEYMRSVAADRAPTEPVPPTSTTPESAAMEWETSAETIGSSEDTATEPVQHKTATVLPLSAHMEEKNEGTSSFSAAVAEPSIQTSTESPTEPSLSTVETHEDGAAFVERSVKQISEVSAEDVQIQGTDSGVITAKEPLIETTLESPVAARHFPMATLETRAAVAERPLHPMIDVSVNIATETKSPDSGVVDISRTATIEPLVETTVDASVEASRCLLGIPENRGAVEGSIESTFKIEAVQTNTDSGVVDISYSAEEPLIGTTVEPAVASTSLLESRAAVCKGVVEPKIENEADDSLAHAASIKNAQESAPLNLKNEVESRLHSTESSSGNVTAEEGASKSEQMTLESVTLHVVKGQVGSLNMDEILQMKSTLDEEAEKRLEEFLVQTESAGVKDKNAAETENSSEDERETLTIALSRWESLSEDLQELEGESGRLVKELLCHVPGTGKGSASDAPVGINRESLLKDERGTRAEAMTLESITLSNVRAEVEGLDCEVLLDTWNALEKEAEVLTKEEKMEVKTAIDDAAVFEDTAEAGILTLDSISEATDAIEAETTFILELMVGSEQGQRQPPDSLLVDQKQNEAIDQGRGKTREHDGSILEATTLESVTLAEVEASWGTLETELLSETTDDLQKEAEVLAGEMMMKVENGVASEETAEALETESLSVPEGDALSEARQTDTPMEELLVSIPVHETGVTEGPIGQEAGGANILDATNATGSDEVDLAASVTVDFPDSPAPKDMLHDQEVGEDGAQAEAWGNGDNKLTHTDLDPVQRLFLEKIGEYNNMCRLNEGLLEDEPEYKKHLSEETAKLQRLYGGGDLSSFPEFTFDEPSMDEDSK